MRARTLLAATMAMSVSVAACGGRDDGPDGNLPTSSTESPIISNGGFDNGGGSLTGWTKTQYTNQTGLAVVPPVTFADLQLTASTGKDFTFALSNAVPQSQVPSGLVAGPGVPLWPRTGTTSAVINEYGAGNPPGDGQHQGANSNVNSLKQSWATTNADIDPSDGKVHVRFMLAPELEAAGHVAVNQPYFFVIVRDLTAPRAGDIFTNFNFSNQPGIPWQSQGAGATAMLFTDWQLFDIAPPDDKFVIGDTLEVEVLAAGCQPGAHSGTAWVDGFGAHFDSPAISKTAPAKANVNSDITYTFTVQNGSAATATNVVADEILPRNTTFGSVSAAGATCTAPPANAAGTVLCTYASMAPNETRTFSVVAHNTNPPATGAGTATAGTANTLTDSGKAWTVNQFAGFVAYITAGTGAGEQATIVSNTATQLTVTPNWGTTPTATSTYIIIDPPGTNAIPATAVTAGTTTTITAAAPGWTANQWVGWTAGIQTGTGAGQAATIVGNTATTLTVSPAFATAPNATSTFTINMTGTSGLGTGTATAGGGATLTQAGANWRSNQWLGWTVTILSKGGGGTPVGEQRTIVSNTATQLTVANNWSANPNANNTFAINLPVDNITNGNYGVTSATTTRVLGPPRTTSLSTGLVFADLSITKSDGVAAVAGNGSMTYTIVVKNNGPATATGAVVKDTFPAALATHAWTCAGVGCNATSGSTNINETVNLAAGASITYTVNATLNIATGTVTNLATVADPASVVDSFPSSNSAADTDDVGVVNTITANKDPAFSGTGSVTSEPASISCGTSCTTASGTFLHNSTVTLYANPDPGSTFVGWTGACAFAGAATSCTVTMTADLVVGVAFDACGNGVLDPGEGCDDGGKVNGDGCNSTCKVENTFSCNATAPGATGDSSCASGVCDAVGNAAPGKCEAVGCGDGRIEAGESCDDGGTANGDGCNAACKIENTFACGAGGDASCASGICDTVGNAAPGKCEASGCGDGRLEAGESCDDGGTANGDGCNAACKIENTFACGAGGDTSCASGVCDSVGNPAPGKCEAAGCGDGHLAAGEGCDDGNTTNGDGCNAACKVENTFTCGAGGDTSCASGVCDSVGNPAPGKCEAAGCGDGHLAAGEGCDDGNTTNGDGCNSACKLETGRACNTTAPGSLGDASCASAICDTTGGGAGTCENAGCGDGRLEVGESCDDGGNANGDGCNATCKIENTFACGASGDTSCASGVCDTVGNAAPGKCEAAGCGDGHLTAGEGCDDGNVTGGDGCNAACKVENTFTCGAGGDTSCASGICDSVGNAAPGTCEASGCGDGRLEAGEGCDDGGNANGDGCTATCKVENTFACGAGGDTSCASGICDSVGNPAPGKCEPSGCGDGHLEAGEGCDDGNLTNGDGCNAACKLETGRACNTTAPGSLGDASCASAICDTTGGGAGRCENAGCGDGRLEAGEGCDDGGNTSGDGCTATCKVENTFACNANAPGATGDSSCSSGVCNASGGAPGVCQMAGCGDAHLQAGEGCDDGNKVGGDGCSATCKVENSFSCNATAPGALGDTSCVSGICDTVGNGAPGKCEPSGCGDGRLEAGEGCDDGGTANGDGCNTACKIEDTFTCGAGGDTSCASGICDAVGNAPPGKCEPAGCGDGHLEAGEGCDDGNLTSGDGCDATCKIENGHTCGATGDPSCESGICDPTGGGAGTCETAGCGDGRLEAGEGCDDGGVAGGDGCDALCKIENTKPCNTTPPGATGNASCESGVCNPSGGGAGVCQMPGCGDGQLGAGEGCDDGNLTGGDGCNGSCKIENAHACNATAPGTTGDTSCASNRCDTVGNAAPGVCEVAGCGDGHLDLGEGCDDGNTTTGDGCSATCKIENGKPCGPGGDPTCASGTCDPTNNTCEPTGCGDGHLAAGEGCDDGNVVDNDGCSATCKIENTHPCNATAPGAIGDASCESNTCNLTGGGAGVCEMPGCGDGHLAAGEGCDDGNLTPGDGCNASCKIENGHTCGATGDTSCASGTCDPTNTTCEMTGCGDGHLAADEGCDDGNTTNGDGCNSTCKVEDTFACNQTQPGLTGNPSCDSTVCDTSGGLPGRCVRTDTDGDGIPDAIDLDDDNDGIPDTAEGNGTVDTDGDGIPDSLDLDSDNDGIADAVEAGHALGDLDNNGRIDCPHGVGTNGLCDDVETAPDSGVTSYTLRDTDGDGTPDFRDRDSDNDGIYDATEAGDHLGDKNGDGVIDCPSGFGTNGLCDDLELVPDSGTSDYDGDGSSDNTVLDTDHDGHPDYRDLDSDDDGISDLIEGNSSCPDANADSVCDSAGASHAVPPDTDGDGVPDYRDLDSDDDGISDLIEGGSGCADVDGNSICDGDDPDNDGIASSADGAPRSYGDAGVTAPPNTDGRGPADWRDLDSDDDGIPDLVEGGSGCTDADNNGVCDGDDSDGDGIRGSADGAPSTFGDAGAAPATDTDGDGTPDYRDLDSDGDKIPDVVEGGHGDLDGNGDGVIDDPTDVDHDGIVDGVDNMPSVFGGEPYTKVDPDGDGHPNFQDPDSNGDGIIDGAGVSGGGCSAGGSPSLLLGLVLAALALRRRRALVVVAALAPALAQAEPAKFPVERFELSTDRNGLFDIEGAEGRGSMALDVGLWLGYANDPLVVYVQGADGRERSGSLVQDRIGGSLVASLSYKWWLSFGMEMPLIVSQSRSTGTSDIAPMGLDSLSSFGTGNLRFMPKLGILRESERGIGLAFVPTLIIPTESSSSAYFGDSGFAFSPELALAKHWNQLRLAVEAGYRARKNEQLANLMVEDELFARFGVGYRVTDPLEVGLTNSWATAAAHPFGNFNDDHLESFVGASYRVTPLASVFGGAGVGWQNGFGTPDWRMLAGVRVGSPDPGKVKFVKPPPLPLDTDGDGIVDTLDKCPLEPEDKDGFEDSDGCPDPDNDHDGVPDIADECPNVAGEVAFKGCPDSDQDGVPDALDKCPTVPEDQDAFEDEDGCPDPDNDKDGVLDVDDKCINIPGSVENHGCPDPDRDGDGVVDRLDNCPDEPGPVENHGCKKKQLVTITAGTLVIIQSVYFQLDKAVILPKSFELLDQVAQVIGSHPTLVIQVEGHTDSQGDDAYNKKLSQKRADSVVAYLVKRKIDPARLKAVGFGEDKPIADNTTKEGRAQNRRVVFTIISGGDDVKTSEQGADDGTKEK